MKAVIQIIVLPFLLTVGIPHRIAAQHHSDERQNMIRQFAQPQKSISITYYMSPQGATPVFSAILGSNIDAINGAQYNNGSAISYSVRSDKTYTIRISAENTAMQESSALNKGAVDVRDFIYCSIVSNNTGGTLMLQNADGNGEPIGTSEKTIIANCPATDIDGHSEEESRSFSLIFRIKAGYSISPGNYTTSILVTASYE